MIRLIINTNINTTIKLIDIYTENIELYLYTIPITQYILQLTINN